MAWRLTKGASTGKEQMASYWIAGRRVVISRVIPNICQFCVSGDFPLFSPSFGPLESHNCEGKQRYTVLQRILELWEVGREQEQNAACRSQTWEAAVPCEENMGGDRALGDVVWDRPEHYWRRWKTQKTGMGTKIAVTTQIQSSAQGFREQPAALLRLHLIFWQGKQANWRELREP